MDGSTSPTCDIDNDQCDCQPFVTGKNCDTCMDGYYGFPDCHPEGIEYNSYHSTPSGLRLKKISMGPSWVKEHTSVAHNTCCMNPRLKATETAT